MGCEKGHCVNSCSNVVYCCLLMQAIEEVLPSLISTSTLCSSQQQIFVYLSLAKQLQNYYVYMTIVHTTVYKM